MLSPAAIREPDANRDRQKHRREIRLPSAGGAPAGAPRGNRSGLTATGADPVSFTWQSSDSVAGTMSATLAGSQTFNGQYFQITRQTRVDNLGPLWVGWHHGWRGYGWDNWDAGPSFITNYSGRVVANPCTGGSTCAAIQLSSSPRGHGGAVVGG